VTTELAPVAEDMSAFIIAGQVSSEPGRYERETEGRTPAQGVQDGVDAERLGFRRVWLSERWDIKQADVILSAIGAKTTRLEIGSGIIVPSTRHAWSTAALGATFHATHGERFILGLGRGEKGAFKGMGIKVTTFEAMADYVDIYRRLWAGEAVSYDGPAGKFTHLAFGETYIGMGAKCLVEAGFDGIILPPIVTPAMVAAAKERIRVECERFGRDPASIRVVVPVVTAPDMDYVEAMSISAGRLVTYLQYPYYGDALAAANGWDLGPVNEMRNHEQFKGLARAADLTFHRHEMLGPASLLPEKWIYDSCAIGTVDECVKNLQRFIDAGADEIATYGSTPRQNGELVAAWRDRNKG
jgi:5,10-methylenetetrahydromethanopterin reductase